MSKSWKRSICEGALCAALTFVAIEFIVESIYKKTTEVLEFFMISPNAPKSLEIYYNIQVGKGFWGFILSLVGLLAAKMKFDVEINLWHPIGVFLGLLGYGFYIALSYSHLFPVT